MSLSLTPFFTNGYWPAIPNWDSSHRHLDRHMARLHRLINDTTYHFTPDQHGVYHRQPNYSYEENDHRAYLEVELPGVPKENVNIHLQGKSLVISAKRFKPGATVHVHVTSADDQQDEPKDAEEESKAPTPSVVYQLKLRISQKYDAANIHATMDGDGLLKMAIPLKKQQAARPIQIQSANM